MAPPPPAASAPAAAGGVAAVFAELNRGEEVTKGLRKVDKSQMTHKNPALRASGVVSSTTSSSGEWQLKDHLVKCLILCVKNLASAPTKRPVKPSKPQSLMGKKPAKFALEGNKWVIVS